MELHPAGLVVARTPPGNDAVSFSASPDKYPSARFDCMSKFPISQRLHWRGLVMAISFALPTFAQRKDTRDLGIVQQRSLLGVAEALDEFGEFHQALDKAYNENNAAADGPRHSHFVNRSQSAEILRTEHKL
jgi:hypothetical protein